MNTHPTIHLGGTTAPALLEQALAALEAVRNADAALLAAAPHGRDYLTGHDLAAAQEQVAIQRAHLDNMRIYWEARAEYLVDHLTGTKGT